MSSKDFVGVEACVWRASRQVAGDVVSAWPTSAAGAIERAAKDFFTESMVDVDESLD